MLINNSVSALTENEARQFANEINDLWSLKDYSGIENRITQQGFLYSTKRENKDEWVMSGTLFTFQPELSSPGQQEFGWFAEQSVNSETAGNNGAEPQNTK